MTAISASFPSAPLSKPARRVSKFPILSKRANKVCFNTSGLFACSICFFNSKFSICKITGLVPVVLSHPQSSQCLFLPFQQFAFGNFAAVGYLRHWRSKREISEGDFSVVLVGKSYDCMLSKILESNNKNSPAENPKRIPPAFIPQTPFCGRNPNPNSRRISKTLVSVLRKSISPENSFRKTESELKPRRTARILGGQNPKKKNVLSILEKTTPAKTEKQGTFFLFLCCREKRG